MIESHSWIRQLQLPHINGWLRGYSALDQRAPAGPVDASWSALLGLVLVTDVINTEHSHCLSLILLAMLHRPLHHWSSLTGKDPCRGGLLAAVLIGARVKLPVSNCETARLPPRAPLSHQTRTSTRRQSFNPRRAKVPRYILQPHLESPPWNPHKTPPVP